jgi:hypothetical protein
MQTSNMHIYKLIIKNRNGKEKKYLFRSYPVQLQYSTMLQIQANPLIYGNLISDQIYG